jgi:hypothetical protein
MILNYFLVMDNVTFGCVHCGDSEVSHLKVPNCMRCGKNDCDVTPLFADEFRQRDFPPHFPPRFLNSLIICRECEHLHGPEFVCQGCDLIAFQKRHAFYE